MPTPPPPRGVQAAVVVVAEGPRVAGSTALHGLVRAGSSGLLALQGPPGAAVPAAAEAAAGGGAEDEEPEVAAAMPTSAVDGGLVTLEPAPEPGMVTLEPVE